MNSTRDISTEQIARIIDPRAWESHDTFRACANEIDGSEQLPSMAGALRKMAVQRIAESWNKAMEVRELFVGLPYTPK